MKNRRLTPLILVWGLAFVAMLIIELCFFKSSDVLLLVPCFWMFPGGLITELFGSELGDGWLGLAVGWLAYLVVMLAALFSNKRLLYYVFFCVLCLMLCLNIVGCHKDVIDFSES
jgi:peptidoglycan/LPS O-acetylase OafA/YrhL